MTRFLPIFFLSVTAMLMPHAATAAEPDISGKWGDTNGRLGCSKDNEFLTFDKAGTVTIPEGQKLSFTRAGKELRLAVGKGDVLTLSIASADKMDLVKFERGGKTDPAALDTWKKRHGQFVRCE